MNQTWKRYLSKQKKEYMYALIPSGINADIIIVIPCFNEYGLIDTLKNICRCERPDTNILIIIVVNSSENSSDDILFQNRETYKQLKQFADDNNESGLIFFPLLFEKLQKKHAGVGLARKIGMDLSIEYFYRTGKKDGIIISLDADCEVSQNFLIDIYSAFRINRKLNVTIHNFHHRIEENCKEIEFAVRQYEEYLNYYSYSLKKSGFPYYYHTIGSAFAVTADAYVRAGGMGRQQGGEDFYFLQKVFELDGVKELKNTFVYPLARFSDRVPFGTGPAIQKILDEPDKILKVYSRQSFYELKKFFDLKELFFKNDEKSIALIVSTLHPALVNFLNENEYLRLLKDCNENCATIESFIKRFFHNFNAFRIVKYLNYVHPDPFMMEKINMVSDKYQSRV